MTDAEIDRLTGLELRVAVALGLGFTVEGEGLLRSPDGRVIGNYDLARYDTDLGLAMRALMETRSFVRVSIGLDSVSIEYSHFPAPALSNGPKADMPAIICRAFLKLKARE